MLLHHCKSVVYFMVFLRLFVAVTNSRTVKPKIDIGTKLFFNFFFQPSSCSRFLEIAALVPAVPIARELMMPSPHPFCSNRRHRSARAA